ncbi:hypothetical protein O3Q51_00300 [Cryomorphaceae bacterium 1068]|nr:hypothetical protein [Cryomorphaceae bacterium 1068]
MKILLWCLFSLSMAASGQDSMTTNQLINRTYPVGERDRLEVENKYGDVIIETSEGDELKIRVEVTLSGGSEKAISELKDFVNVEINKNGSFIVAKTHWGKNASFFTKSLEGIKGVFDGDRSVEVNYLIEAPSYLDMRITNKFGDVYIGDHEGRLDIDLSHGDLRSRRIAFPEKVSVSYGKMIVDEWGKGRVEIYFGEIDSKLAQDLTIKSKNSEIEFEEAGKLFFHSQNDEIHIEKVGELGGDFRFTKTRVDVLTKNLNIEQDYGDLRVSSMDPNFVGVDLRLKKSDVTLIIDESTPFNFSVYLTDGETFSSVPELVTLKRDEQIGDERQMEGFWKAPHPSRKVTVKGESAVVNIAKK